MTSNDQKTYIASVVALYWFVSISMVYLNKVLMSSDGISIDAPLFVTWFQCIVTALICYAAGEVGERSRRTAYKAIDNQDAGTDLSEPKSPFLSQFPKAGSPLSPLMPPTALGTIPRSSRLGGGTSFPGCATAICISNPAC